MDSRQESVRSARGTTGPETATPHDVCPPSSASCAIHSPQPHLASHLAQSWLCLPCLPTAGPRTHRKVFSLFLCRHPGLGCPAGLALPALLLIAALLAALLGLAILGPLLLAALFALLAALGRLVLDCGLSGWAERLTMQCTGDRAGSVATAPLQGPSKASHAQCRACIPQDLSQRYTAERRC